jgi:hypothetical protein
MNAFSMLYTFTAYHLNYRHANYLEIEPKGPPLQILIVELYLDRDWQFITAVHLGPAGQSRHQNVDASLGPKRNQIILIEQCRARPYKAQVSAQHGKQLRQFIEAAAAEETANGSQIICWIR